MAEGGTDGNDSDEPGSRRARRECTSQARIGQPVVLGAVRREEASGRLIRMKYERFEDLPVWKAALELAARVYMLVEDPSFRAKGDLRDQLQRASLSVSNNIAEGFELGTTQQLISFLYNARGSAGEVRNMCWFMERLPYWEHLKFEISNLKLMSENVSRQLQGFAGSLQNSEIKGQRYLTEPVRDAASQKARAEAFLRTIEQYRAGGRADEEPKRAE